jgi:hypothetical protein
MNSKKEFRRAKFLVFFDIIFTALSIITGWVLKCTPADALNPKYQEEVSDSLSFFLFLLFIIGLVLMLISWTMILCREGKKAIKVYAFAIPIGYCSTFYFIWVVNGFEHIFGALKLLVSGMLIWHLHITDIKAKEEQKSESKPNESPIDQKTGEPENEKAE